MEERRRHPRVEIMLTGSSDGMTCQLKDISTLGMQFLTAQPFPEGGIADLTLQVTLQVKWCEKIDEETYAVGGEKWAAKWIPRTDGGDEAKASPELSPDTEA